MIKAKALRKQYGDLVAVDDLSVEVRSGEVFGLLGPNGAGKTTTISMLVGVLNPDGGTVSIDGSSDPTRPDVRKMIGNAPQALALYDALTAEENLLFFGKLYGLSGSGLKKRAQACLELVGLKDRAKDKVATFSGGMQRRLNMACALVHNPPLLLLDEPTVGVDPQSRNLIFDRIESLKNDGCTIVYTTHYMEEAQRLCDRVAIMDHGKILDLDTVPNLIAKHGGMSVVSADLNHAPDANVELPGVLDDLHLRFESDNPLEEVAGLTSKDITFHTLKIDQPDLESVFLNLTGRRLRD